MDFNLSAEYSQWITAGCKIWEARKEEIRSIKTKIEHVEQEKLILEIRLRLEQASSGPCE